MFLVEIIINLWLEGLEDDCPGPVPGVIAHTHIRVKHQQGLQTEKYELAIIRKRVKRINLFFHCKDAVRSYKAPKKSR